MCRWNGPPEGVPNVSVTKCCVIEQTADRVVVLAFPGGSLWDTGEWTEAVKEEWAGGWRWGRGWSGRGQRAHEPGREDGHFFPGCNGDYAVSLTWPRCRHEDGWGGGEWWQWSKIISVRLRATRWGKEGIHICRSVGLREETRLACYKFVFENEVCAWVLSWSY